MRIAEALPDSVLARSRREGPQLSPEQTVGEVRLALIGQRFDDLDTLAVCAGEFLVGLIRIEEVMAGDSATTVGQAMDPAPPTAHRDTDQEVAAWNMVRHGHEALAIVDDDNRYLGIVTPSDMLSVLLEEHEEDLSRMAGVVHDTEQVRTATVESVTRRVAHRLPWLIVGLAGAMAAAMVVAGYEDDISKQVTLAFFLPGVVYMADAVGTQTETVVVRGLSVGVGVRQVAPKESLTGLIIGTVVAVLFVPLGTLVFGDVQVMLAVALALFVSCAVASVIAMALPFVFDRLHLDPAYGSGPLSTVVQDLLTIICYCAIVTTLV
jgi:magnesium transporter